MPDFTIETFSERHHLDLPHRVEPERLANSLLALWQRGEYLSCEAAVPEPARKAPAFRAAS